MKKVKKGKCGAVLMDYALITLGVVIAASAIYFFLVPSHLVVGSIAGMAIVITELTGISMTVITMGLNILFLILGLIFVGREFGVKTIYTSMLLPVILGVWEYLFPDFESVMGDPFLDLICFCLFIAMGQAILFWRNASSGGLDIAAKIVNKYLRLDLGVALTLCGTAVSLSAAFAYDVKTVVLSLLGTYLSGTILDHFLFGINSKKKVCIISDENDIIRDFVLHELRSGATLYDAVGAFTNEVRRELTVIVNKAEYSQLMSFISKTDENAFVTVYTVNEIIYRPKNL